jgi:hypothetical protein
MLIPRVGQARSSFGEAFKRWWAAVIVVAAVALAAALVRGTRSDTEKIVAAFYTVIGSAFAIAYAIFRTHPLSRVFEALGIFLVGAGAWVFVAADLSDWWALGTGLAGLAAAGLAVYVLRSDRDRDTREGRR